MDTDVEALLAHLKHADKQIKLKRRFLMGLSSSKYEDENESLQNRCLPEVLLREDDVFYETSKTFLEKAFGIRNRESDYHTFQKIMQCSDNPCISKELRSSLDDISNTGLYLLAMHLSKGHSAQIKTRRKLKKVIQGCMQRMQKCERKLQLHSKECAQLSQVVSDPCFFHKGDTSSFTSSHQSSIDKVKWVLNNLKDFPMEVLLSIHRKLKGDSGKLLHLRIQRSGWNRDRLIERVKKVCISSLAELEEGDGLPRPLAKAMAVTTLSMKLAPGIQNPNLEDFYQFPPDIVALQNNIAKAIWLINEKVRVPELRELQMLFELDSDLPIKGLRSAIRKLLTLYLFECDDMDVIPSSLLDALSLINRNSRRVSFRCLSTEEIDKEIDENMECLLGVGAQVKQVILDLLPDHNYEQEFTDAYMEDLQESESDESDSDDAFLSGSDSLPTYNSCMNDSAEAAESVGESLFTEKDVSDVGRTISGSNTSENMEIVAELTGATSGHLLSNSESTNTRIIGIDEEQDPSEKGGSSNKYLCVQDACDEASLFAYKYIGNLLKECARLQCLNLDQVEISYLRGGHSITDHSPDAIEKQALGDDLGGMFICQVVEELYPSVSNSVKAKLEELMSLPSTRTQENCGSPSKNT